MRKTLFFIAVCLILSSCGTPKRKSMGYGGSEGHLTSQEVEDMWKKSKK